MLMGLLPCRTHFYRRSSLIGQRFTPAWVATITLILVCTLWLGFFSYKHLEYSNDLWWQFSFTGDASRFLRAMVGTMVAVLFFAIAHLLRPAPPAIALASAADLQRAKPCITQSLYPHAHLALLADKSLLFNEAGNAFIMYGVAGRTWVAMGDPIGPPEEQRELAWKFRELCEYHDGWTVFYQVRPQNLDIYLELGLTLLKIGEEARVPLSTFSIEGKAHKNHRYTVNRLEKSGCRFEIIPADAVEAVLPTLKGISNAWLNSKSGREKRFSLGFYQEDYLQTGPLAVVHCAGQPVAFANLWIGDVKEEFSIDLMRHTPEAPPGVMDYLFLKLMLWGKNQGYHCFNMGMAPLSGLQNRNLAPLWNRFGALVFGYGERFYNFQGVREYKEKFHPQWESRYLAVPGGIALPLILTNISGLIAGGLQGVIKK
jgi:phosphatidylglycerol lysyltransferase